MSYQHKYYMTLVVAVISGISVLDASSKLQGSMGVSSIIVTAGWQLAVSVLVFAISAPAAVYFNTRRKAPPTKEEQEIEMLLKMKHYKK